MSGSSSFDACSRCSKRIRASAPRCPHCGQRTGFAGAPAPTPAPAPAAADGPAAADPGFQRLVLTDVQKDMLLAAVDDPGPRARIFLQGPTASGPGEVKAGNQRLFGDDAVVGALDLVEPGLLERVSDGCYELTDDGLRVAEMMRNPMRRRSSAIWLAGGLRKADAKPPL